jgi:sugar lactone lactonase YvrE
MTEPRSTYRLIDLPGQGPEDVVVDGNGFVLTGLNDGRILRVDADTGRAEVLVSTDGRPLGLEVLPDGRILICDSPKGLLLFDPATSELKTLVQEDRGQTLPFCSNVVAAPDGTIYFSVSTMRYTIHGWRKDIVENVPTGRLYRLSAAGHLEKLMDGILFANGVALAPDGSHVVLAETGKCRLHRYWLKGPKAGKSDILCVLPGYPDNSPPVPMGWCGCRSRLNATMRSTSSTGCRCCCADLSPVCQSRFSPNQPRLPGSWRLMPKGRPFMTSGGQTADIPW